MRVGGWLRGRGRGCRPLAALAIVVGAAEQLAVLHVGATRPLTLGLKFAHLVGALHGAAAELLMLLLAEALRGRGRERERESD